MTLTASKGPSIAPRSTLVPFSTGPGAVSSPDLANSPGAVTSIVTSREWVLPPRPKPGRKPSADTPASKRKAQNRAAQRVFRERRATRVQELEQKLLEIEKEKELKEIRLVNIINKLKFENQFLVKSMNQLRQEFSYLKSSASEQAAISPNTKNHVPQIALLAAGSPANVTSNFFRSEDIPSQELEITQMAQSLLNFAKSQPASQSKTSNMHLPAYSVQQILPAPSADSPRAFLSRSRENSSKISILETAGKTSQNFDCGICIKDLCLCEDVGLKATTPSYEEAFKSIKPMAAVSLKRRSSLYNKETDFTTMFSSSKKMPGFKRLRSSYKIHHSELPVKEEPSQAFAFEEDSPVENCGFCSDDTPCVCREAAKEAARLSKSLSDKFFDGAVADADDGENSDNNQSTALPPLQLNSSLLVRNSSLPVLHPGPTLEIREFSHASATTPVQEPVLEKVGCTGNPGTCSQCQLDPMSTLFCTTVASKAAMQDSGSLSEIEIPQKKEAVPPKAATPEEKKTTVADSGIFIPCADAYKTLSRHRRFNSLDFSSLVGRLTTRGMQVEVQSVANILRELDRKVYD